MNYIIVATSPGGFKSFVSSTRHETLSNDANEAARFVQSDSALEAARVMIESSDFERKFNVVLSIGLVKTVVESEIKIPRKATKPGFVIVFAHEGRYAPYSTAPKKPKEFDYQHCNLCTENIDKATRYATREEAETRVRLMTSVVHATCTTYSMQDRRRFEEDLQRPWLNHRREFVDTWGERAKEFKLEIKEV
jgi:hypothetical protein